MHVGDILHIFLLMLRNSKNATLLSEMLVLSTRPALIEWPAEILSASIFVENLVQALSSTAKASWHSSMLLTPSAQYTFPAIYISAAQRATEKYDHVSVASNILRCRFFVTWLLCLCRHHHEKANKTTALPSGFNQLIDGFLGDAPSLAPTKMVPAAAKIVMRSSGKLRKS